MRVVVAVTVGVCGGFAGTTTTASACSSAAAATGFGGRGFDWGGGCGGRGDGTVGLGELFDLEEALGYGFWGYACCWVGLEMRWRRGGA